MFGFSIEQLLTILGYGGVFVMMTSNGVITLPASQILYIVAGYFAATGFFDFFTVALVGALGNTLGNFLLYELARRKGERYITRLLLFPESQVHKVQRVFERRGIWFLFVGKLLPALKVFVPIPAGIAKMHRGTFGLVIVTSSYLWACGFLSIGYFFGKSADVFGKYAFVIAIVTVAVLWLFYRSMQQEESSIS